MDKIQRLSPAGLADFRQLGRVDGVPSVRFYPLVHCLSCFGGDRVWTISGTLVDRITDSPKGVRNRLPGLSTLLNTLSRHEVDAVKIWSVAHLRTSVDTLLDILGDHDRYGVKLVTYDQESASGARQCHPAA